MRTVTVDIIFVNRVVGVSPAPTEPYIMVRVRLFTALQSVLHMHYGALCITC